MGNGDESSDNHPDWEALINNVRAQLMSRRNMLGGSAAAVAGLGLASLLMPGQTSSLIDSALGAGLPDKASWKSRNKIKHIVVLCQENRSFDHYFGSFATEFGKPGAKALGFSPSKLSYPTGKGTEVHPTHLTHYCDEDPDHSWEGSHAKWNKGAMNGFVSEEAGATFAAQYFEPADHIYHVELAKAFKLADHNFCSQIGPTLPNRLYLWSGTSGWDYLTPTTVSDSLPFNNPSLAAVPPSLKWPTMADVLQTADLPWKCYSVADGSVPSAIGAFNPLIFFPSIMENPAKAVRATADMAQFFADLEAGTLPAVSWIVTEAVVSEHPPAPPDMGQLLAARVVSALMESSAWESTALFVTYDEGGGFFEHVAPHILEYVPTHLPDGGEAIGLGFRVPLIIVSPFVDPGTVFKDVIDHTSILQFIERTFTVGEQKVHLPTIAASRRKLASLELALDFSRPVTRPALPTAAQLYARAKQTVLTLNAEKTVADCSTSLPTWLPQLLGV